MTTSPASNEMSSQLRRALTAVKDLRARLEQVERARSEPIAIIGMGCRFPGADSPAAFWELLRNGVDAIGETPSERWDSAELYDPDPEAAGMVATRWGGFLTDLDRFDAAFFGIAPREAAQMDPQQRLLLEVAWETLEDGGQAVERLAGSKTGVFVGVHSHSSDYYLMQTADPRGLDLYSGTGTSHSVVSGRLSYLLDLRGPSVAIDTACSSSLVAVHLAVQSLRSGECSLALAGGVNTILDPNFTIVASRMHMMSADGRCKPFDSRADGFVRGEGCGLVLLKRLSDAVVDGDRILAVIRGSAMNQDGRSNGLTAPNSFSQQAVIGEALANAGLSARQIGLLEAHGTGTALGDPIEVEALSAVFGLPEAGQVCALGSAKANIGHLEGAAGVAGLIKAVLTLRHEQVPPLPHFRQLNPHISLEHTPFVIPTAPRDWPAGEQPRYAGVSSFGWSGTNAHVIVGEAPQAQPAAREDDDGPYLLPISARSPAALRRLAHAYQALLADEAGDDLRDICASAGLRRTHHEQRLAVAGRTREALAEQLQRFLRGERRPGDALGHHELSQQRSVAFVFSGQGPQWWAMGRELLAQEPVFRELIERCDTLLHPLTGWSLLEELARPEDASRLDQTEIAQPALFALQIGLAAVWRSWGIVPDGVVGHSVGEVAAAFVAGALSLEDAVRVIAHRGRLMQAATGNGKMASVELPVAAVEPVIAPYGERLSIAALNAPALTVISGEPGALDEATEAFKALGASVRPLPVNYAFHSAQMAPHAQELARALAGLAPQAGRLPLFSTVTGALVDGAELDAGYWARNVRQPVRFAAAIEAMATAGCDVFVEIGPHPVLGGAVARTLAGAGREGTISCSLRRGRPERETLLAALGELYVCGVAVDWTRVLPAGGRAVDLPSYPWQRERYWLALPGARREQIVAGNSLLGRRLPPLAPMPGVSMWAGDLEPAAITPSLRRSLAGAEIVSAALYAGLALEAAAALDGATPCLRELVIRSDLVLTAAAPRTTQVAIMPGRDGAEEPTALPSRLEVRVYSRDGESQPWVEHCGAEIDGDDDSLARVDLRAAQASCATKMPPLPGLDEVERGSHEALARLQVEAGEDDISRHLGAGLQLLELLVATTGASELALTRIDRIIRRGNTAPTWAYARLGELGQDQPAGDMYLLDTSGRIVFAAVGVRFCTPAPELLTRLAQARASEWLYELAWRDLAAAEPRRAQRLLLFTDGDGLGAELARLLAARGGEATLVYAGAAFGRADDGSYTIDPGSHDDLRRLFAEVRADGGAPLDAAVYLWGIGPDSAEGASGAQLLDRQRSIAGGALALSQAIAAGDGPRLWLVTRGAVAVGQEPVAVEQATLWGLGRVIANEYPDNWGGLIDIEPGAAAPTAGRLLDALFADDGEDQVALRGAARLGARLIGAGREAGAPSALRADATYLITGGLGGVGLVLARWMLANGARNLALLGRRPLDEAAGSTIRELEQGGARVVYLQADVARADVLAEALARLAQAMPRLRGVVHAAGVLDDAALLGQSWAGFERVMQAKVAGAWNLHTQTAGMDLELFVLCSSASALIGMPGQANYAAANAFLDALAHARRAAGLAALSINWGRWDEVGLATRAGRDEYLSRRGLIAMPPAAGAAAFGALRGHPAAQLTVAAIDWPTLIGQLPRAGATPLLRELGDGGVDAASQTEAEQPDLLAALAQAPEADRYERCLEYVLARVAAVLRFERAEQVVPDRGFFQLGMDSLTAVELRNQIGRSLGRTFSATLAFDYPTAAGLTRHLLAELFPAEAAPAAELEDEAMLDAIGQLSRDDINALLDAELNAIDG